MPWRLYERGNFHFSGDSRVSRNIQWHGWRHEYSTLMMMSLLYYVTCVHVTLDDVADVTSFLHQWRWACHLEDKRRCECSLSPARRNELEPKVSSFLTLRSCKQRNRKTRYWKDPSHGILSYFGYVQNYHQIVDILKIAVYYDKKTPKR